MGESLPINYSDMGGARTHSIIMVAVYDIDMEQQTKHPSTTAELLQQTMTEQAAREKRLADEPAGPEKPQTADDYRAFAATLEVGDTIVADDGVEETIEEIQPAEETELGEFEGIETVATLSFDKGDGSESYQEPMDMLGSKIARGVEVRKHE